MEKARMMGLALSPAHAVPLGSAFEQVEGARREDTRYEYFAPPVMWELGEEATSNLLVVGPEGSGKTTLARGLVAHALRYPEAWRAYVVAGERARTSDYGGGGGAGALAGLAREQEGGVKLLRDVLAETEGRLETAAAYGAGRVSPPLAGLRDLNGFLADDGGERLPRLLVVLDEPGSLGALALADELAHRGWPAGVHVALVSAREQTVPTRTLRAFRARLAFRWRMVPWLREERGREGHDPAPVVARLFEGGRATREIAVPDAPPEDLEEMLAGPGEGATP